MSKKNKDVRREDNPKVAEKVIGDGETTFEDEPEITDSDPKIGPDEAVDESEDAMQPGPDVKRKSDDEHSEPGNEPDAERDDDKLKAKVEREPDDDRKAISPEKLKELEEDEIESMKGKPEEEVEEGKQMTVRQFLVHTSYSREVKRMMYEKFKDEETYTEQDWAKIVKSLMEFLNKKPE